MQRKGNFVIVRNATAEDLPRYLHLGRMFHAASPMHNVVPFDEEGYAKFYLQAIEIPTVGMWLAEMENEIVGIAGAILYPLYFNPNALVAQELWWWLTPKSRGSGAGALMFRQIENWAKENGASAVFMIALEDSRAKKMEHLYARAGFRPMERTFIKEVPTWQ
jgi:GNAT superfamily N-acetyltransferase